MSSFLNNSEWTKELKVNLSNRLGLTGSQIKHFLEKQRKKPRNESIEAYSKLLQGKGLKRAFLNQCMHACIQFATFYMQCLYVVRTCRQN